jgi:hypothetical protein
MASANPNSHLKIPGLKALAAGLMLAAGAWCWLALSRPTAEQTRNEGCVSGHQIRTPDDMAAAQFAYTSAVGCEPLPSMVVSWDQVFRAGHQ